MIYYCQGCTLIISTRAQNSALNLTMTSAMVLRMRMMIMVMMTMTSTVVTGGLYLGGKVRSRNTLVNVKPLVINCLAVVG